MRHDKQTSGSTRALHLRWAFTLHAYSSRSNGWKGAFFFTSIAYVITAASMILFSPPDFGRMTAISSVVGMAVGFSISLFAIDKHTIANYSLPIYMLITSITASVLLVKYRVKNNIPLREWV